MIHTNEGNRMVIKKPEEERTFNIGLFGVQVTDTDKFVGYRDKLGNEGWPLIWEPHQEYLLRKAWEAAAFNKVEQDALRKLWGKPPISMGTPKNNNQFIPREDLLKSYKPLDDTSNNK